MSSREHAAVDQQAIIVAQDALQTVRLGEYFEITPRGLVVSGDPSFDQCDALWETLLTMEKVIQFAIGDAMRYFRERWGEKADQIITDRTGWSYSTLRAYEWTADKIAPENRRLDALPYSHHQAVAKLSPPEQKEWLDKAAEGDGEKPWTVARLNREVKAVASGDALTYGVNVFCDSEDDQAACTRQLDNLGRRYKTFVSTANQRKSINQ